MSAQRDDSSAADQFWLLTGDVPAGPFTISQIHAKLAIGDATWQTSACLVGGGKWLPLVQTPGIGPGVPRSGSQPVVPASSDPKTELKPTNFQQEEPPPLPLDSSEESPPTVPLSPAENPAASVASPPTNSAQTTEWVKFGIFAILAAVVLFGAYLSYRQIRPLTATEVCKKLDEVNTPGEAKKYVTPRFYPILEAIYANKSPSDPNDTFDWTQEIDGPQPNVKLVGFRGSWFDQEAGKRVRVEGHFRVVKLDGWKVDDMVFTGFEGLSLPGPVSVADEFKRSGGPPKSATPGTPTSKSPSTSTPKSPSPSTENTDFRAALLKWGYEKFGVIGAIVVIIALIAFYVNMYKK